jgi:hypothetical protein
MLNPMCQTSRWENALVSSCQNAPSATPATQAPSGPLAQSAELSTWG